jgi:dynein heavy chain
VIKDDLKWQDVTAKPASGCLCYGLYLEGCKWSFDTHKLCDSDPKKLFVELPLLHLLPVINRVVPETGIYKCPMYKVLSRTGTLSTTGHSTNYVVMMELPMMPDDTQEKWIRAGVAVFLALKF